MLNVVRIAAAGMQDALDDGRVFPNRLLIQRMKALSDAFYGLEKAVIARSVDLAVLLKRRTARFIFFRGHDDQGLIMTKSSPLVTKLLKS